LRNRRVLGSRNGIGGGLVVKGAIVVRILLLLRLLLRSTVGIELGRRLLLGVCGMGILGVLVLVLVLMRMLVLLVPVGIWIRELGMR
jgi:hypothetical protein